MKYKNIIKIGSLAAFLLAPIVTRAQSSAAPVYKEQRFVNGWNLYVTNAVTSGPGVANQLFTTVQGQIVYSLTNNVINGTLNTNTIAPDAFQFATLPTDVNGDYAANTAIHYVLNNTNYIPIAVTNSQGQWFIPPAGFTNSQLTTAYGGWPLQSSQYPVYMYPATTNTYPWINQGTNLVTFYFQRGWKYDLGSAPVFIWDSSTNIFSFIVNPSATPNGTYGVTNLPTAFTQGANLIRCAGITVSTNSVLVNQLSIGAPLP